MVTDGRGCLGRPLCQQAGQGDRAEAVVAQEAEEPVGPLCWAKENGKRRDGKVFLMTDGTENTGEQTGAESGFVRSLGYRCEGGEAGSAAKVIRWSHLGFFMP